MLAADTDNERFTKPQGHDVDVDANVKFLLIPVEQRHCLFRIPNRLR